jgi:hypothetical protein
MSTSDDLSRRQFPFGLDRLASRIAGGWRLAIPRFAARGQRPGRYGESLDQVTKGLFALASYDAGPDKIEKLRALAATGGYDPNRWFNNVEFIAAHEIGAETLTTSAMSTSITWRTK